MSLLLDEWPEPPEPPTLKRRRPVWPWLAAVIVGMASWLAVLPPDEFTAYALLGIALVLALVNVALLARTRTPGWLLAIALLPGLILCSSAATYLTAAMQLEDAEGIPPLNGFVLYFGGIWALIAIVVCSVLTAARALVRWGRRGRTAALRPGAGPGPSGSRVR